MKGRRIELSIVNEKRKDGRPGRQMMAETTSNEKLLQMLHGSRGTVFSKRVPLAAGGPA
jgi:hypothetical protein